MLLPISGSKAAAKKQTTQTGSRRKAG
jgi:hypothetical protein